MSLRTQKAKKGYISAIVLAVLLSFLLEVPSAQAHRGRSVPRFDKTQSQCHSSSQCLRDLHQRQSCIRKQGVPQRECYIRYAAGYYSQSPIDAIRVAKCESYDDLRYWLTAPQVGMWQFNPSTWASLPSIFHKGAGIHSPKYSSLGAMWYWSIGHKYEWVCQ